MRYVHEIKPRAIQKIRSFYWHVFKKYMYTYSYEDMLRNVNQAVNDMYLIETTLHRRKPTLTRWQNQGWHMANTDKWYYAYTIDDDTITIQDACHAQNMHE